VRSGLDASAERLRRSFCSIRAIASQHKTATAMQIIFVTEFCILIASPTQSGHVEFDDRSTCPVLRVREVYCKAADVERRIFTRPVQGLR
jgi:hypothetical protein